jgi:peptidoglycan hydrolase-like protein with peptidoglycan-binding domain
MAIAWALRDPRMTSALIGASSVRQLEQNLVALGYDPDGDVEVDGDFDWATEAAVERWQEDHHLAESGVVALGDVVFLPGARRVGKITAQVGGRAGGEIMQTTSRAREVTLELAATDQDLVRAGQRVRVELPDESTVTGTVSEVGNVATTSAEGETTVPVTVSVPAKGLTSLDAAPVTVSIETERARDALSVPTTALLALAGGGYGVEVVDSGGARTLVGVKTGSFADGYVQVDGEGVGEGTVVVVAE